MPMRREERQRKYHEALLNMLYPPPPSPPQQEDEEEVVATLPEGFNVNSIPDADDQEESGSSSSSDHELERGPQKLSRAQRKRLRKKKLKETALQRRKIIGPLLPSTTNEGGGSGCGCGCGGDALENEPPSVRHNATEGQNSATEEPGYTNSNKLKHRRKAKREGKEKASSSNMVKSDQDSQPCGKDGNSGPNLDGGKEELEQLPDKKYEV